MNLYLMLVVLLTPIIKRICGYLRLRKLTIELEWLNYFLYTQSKQPSLSIRELHVAVNIDDLKVTIDNLHAAVGRKAELSDRTLRNLVNCRTICRGLMDDASASGRDNVFRIIDMLQRPLVLLTEDHITIR